MNNIDLITEQNVIILSTAQKSAVGVVKIQEWDKQQRLKRSLKIFGICWGLALVSIVIPLAHFVLVPGFFLAGPFIAYYFYEQKSVVLGGKGLCPNCEKEFEIVRCSNRWPLTDLCSHCRAEVKINKN